MLVGQSTGGRSKAYLTQAVQSLEYLVPLVAGRPALLRVFVTALRKTNVAMPPVRARFYHGGAEVHVENIPAGSESIPIHIEEGRRSKSANARIPADVVRPYLEDAGFGGSQYGSGAGDRGAVQPRSAGRGGLAKIEEEAGKIEALFAACAAQQLQHHRHLATG